jgi:hypothetical protein
MPRVLGGDEIHFFEHPQGAQRDILKIADRRGNDVQDPNHFATQL